MDHCSGPIRRKQIFRYEAKWALEDDEKQAIQLAWQNRKFLLNCWTNIHLKLLHYSKE